MTIATSYLGAAGDGAEGASGQSVPAGPYPALMAEEAVKQIAEMYRLIQAQSVRMDNLYGAQIPCDVQLHHNESVKAYQKAAKSVFDQILSQNPKYNIVQTVYKTDGSVLARVTNNRPVTPAVYEVVGCPSNAPVFSGFAGAELGIPILLGLAIAVVAGTTVVALAYVVIKNWPLAAVETARAQAVWVSTQLDCVERLMKEQGMTTTAAVQTCKGIVGDAPKASTSWGLWALVLGVGALGGYGISQALKRRSSNA